MKQSSLKKLALGAAWALALFGGPWAGPVQAVHDVDVFELDGNAIDEGTNGDDWDLIYCDFIDPDRNGPCTGVPASSALVGSFFTDPVEDPSDDIFAGAKDSLDIEAGAPQDWQWKIGEPNDKNDIEHAFASIYRDPVSQDFILYFGLDKLSNNGDAALGFWFLQNDVTMLGDGSSNPPCSPSGCPFSDGHEVGDVLVQADITSGGDVPKFDVFTWGPNGLLNDPVAPAQGELTKAIEGSQCDPAVMGDDTCAIMNTDNEDAPWPYLFKFSGGVDPSTTFPTATFFEAGLNLTTLFPNGIPCISAFLAETRQSQSETAELEDKVLGGFDLCSVFVAKTGPEKAKVGDPVTYTVTINNDGALPLTKVSIIDTLAGDLTDGTNTFIDSSDCGADLEPGESCSIVYTLTQPPSSDPLENTVTVRYDRGDDMITGSASHGVNLIQPSITFDKQAEGSNGPLDVLQGATVDYTLALNNTSSDDTPPLVCVITDNLLVIDPNNTDGNNNPNNIGVILTSGNGTTVTASKSFPTPGSFTNTASVSCSPEGFPNTLEKNDSVTVNVLPANVVLMVEKGGDAFSKEGDPVNYNIKITNISNVAVTLTDVTDTVLGDLLDTATPNPFLTGGTCVDNQVLAASASCTITATRTTTANDPDPLVNVVTATVVGAVGGSVSLSDDHSVDLVAPAYTLTKSCASPDPVPAGESANFLIDIVNTGDVDLVLAIEDPLLSISETGITLGNRSGNACGDTDFGNAGTISGDAADGCLRVEDGVIATGDQVVNTVVVTATLQPALGLPNSIEQSAGGVCEVQQQDEATRTWGFWKTHGSDGEDFSSPVDFGYTCHVFEDHQPLAGVMDLGWKTVTSCEQLFDIFWASKARNSDGSRRDNLCQVKLQASRQLAAAQLNEALDNGADAGDAIDNLIAEMGGAMKRKDIIGYMAELAGFNESGDDVAIIDNDGAIIPHADPRGTRLTAEEGFSDCN